MAQIQYGQDEITFEGEWENNLPCHKKKLKNIKWLQLDSNPEPVSSQTNTKMFYKKHKKL